MSACRSSIGRLFHSSDLQLQNARLHSCCMFVSRRTSSMWQNTADYDIRRRPTGSRRLNRLEPCRTVIIIIIIFNKNWLAKCNHTIIQYGNVKLVNMTGRTGWPYWNPPDVEPKASAALIAQAWCGRNVERQAPNVQPHSGQTVAGS